MKCKSLVLAVALFATCSLSVHAQGLFISEVHPTGSSQTYAADWFELTNTGPSAIDLTGWKIDDSTPTFATAVALRGVTSINAGQSIVFFEGNTSGSNDLTIASAFNTAWSTSFVFSTNIGAYGGSGVGLSSSGDAVNLYDSTGTLQASVNFGSATSKVTFDNTAGLTGAISQLSAVGTNGAYLSSINEIGSPGLIPEPSTYALMLGFGALGFVALRRKLGIAV